MSTMGSDETTRLPALGRRVSLGQLYDCRSDKLITGEYLWSPDVMLEGRVVEEQNSSVCDVLEDDTLAGRMAALGVLDDQLRLSILGDMIPLSGASNYINDQRSSTQQERAVLRYTFTQRFEKVYIGTLTDEKVMCSDVYANGSATHVVCGVRYGGQAFFVFFRYSAEGKPPSRMSLADAVKTFTDLELKEDWNINVPEDQANEMLQIKCRVHCDFQIPYHPTNFKDALKLYKSLHSMERIGSQGNPIEMILYPLSMLDPLAARVVQRVNSELIAKFRASIVHLNQVANDASDLLISAITYSFPGIENDMKQFHKLLVAFQGYFQHQIGVVVGRVRGGSAVNEMMKIVLNRKEESPFAKQQLDTWLKQKHVQLQILKQNDLLNDASSAKPHEQFVTHPTPIATSRQSATKCSNTESGPLESAGVSGNRYLMCFHVSMFGKNCFTKVMSKYMELANDGILGKFDSDALNLSRRKKDSEHTLKLASDFRDFVEVNRLNPNVVFSYVEDTQETDKPDVYITLTRDGELLCEDYQLPTAPEAPVLVKAHHNQLAIKWTDLANGRNVPEYEMRCREKSGTYEKKVRVGKNKDTLTLTDLKIGTAYQVQVRTVCEVGCSPWSLEISPATKPGTPPGRPKAEHTTYGGVSVSWAKPSNVAPNTATIGYMLTVRNVDTQRESQLSTECQEEELTVYDLNPFSCYTFSVRALFEEGESDDSEVSQVLDPDANTKLKAGLLKDAKIVKRSNPVIHSIGLRESLLENVEKVRKCELGHARDDHPEKVIMVVGATGAGKTTLINGMVNHALGVRWKDNFRFRLVVDAGEASGVSQAHSQTKWITSYTLHYQEGFRVPYTLTVIDTPGYGDTSGIKKDQETTQQIHKFFTTKGQGGIDHIDAIGFVTQASQARLTPTQRFIFDQVRSLFGKDIADNIFLLITFADGQKPPVLDGVEAADVPFKEYFVFNNSALYVRNDGADSSSELPQYPVNPKQRVHDDFGPMFWEMGAKSFNKFFDGLNRTESKSLILTKDVLNERKSLEAYVIGVHQHIRSGLNKLEQLSHEVDILRRFEAEIETNKDFTYEVPEEKVKTVNIPTGTYITNCLTCNFTCHYPCGISDDGNKERCWAMNKHGVCRVCPALCEWTVHKNMTYKFEVEVVMKKKTAEELKARYETANEKKLTAEELVKKVTEELEGVQLNVVYYANEIRKSLDRLKEIALRPNPLSTVEYIDILIQTEESKRSPGWKDRRQQLLDIRKHAETLQLLAKPGYDPFEEYKTKFQEMRQKGEKEQSIFQSLKTYVKEIFE